jgi:hypothetical protein
MKERCVDLIFSWFVVPGRVDVAQNFFLCLIMDGNIFRIFVGIFQEYDCMLLVGYSVGYVFLRIKKKGLDLHLSP